MDIFRKKSGFALMVARANIPVFYNFFSRFTYYNSTFVVHFNIGAMTFHEMEATGDLLLRYLRIYSWVPTNRDKKIGTFVPISGKSGQRKKFHKKVILRWRITLLGYYVIVPIRVPKRPSNRDTFRKSYSSRLVGTLLYIV